MTEEALGGRGHWIESTELDLDNFEPGVNAPCPGAYQQLMGYDPDVPPLPFFSKWSGPNNAHSQMVESMTVYHYRDGKVIDFDLQMIEGNWKNKVYNQNVYMSAPRYTPDGGNAPEDYLGENMDRKIRGWGIDRYINGDPRCRMDKVTYVLVPDIIPFPYDHLFPYLVVDELDQAQVEENEKFAEAVDSWGGVRTTINAGEPTYMPLPSQRQPWPIDVPEKQAVVTVDFPLPPPYPIGTVELRFVGLNLPGIVTVHVRGADASVNLRKGGPTAILALRKPTVAQTYRFWIKAPGKETLTDLAIEGIYFHPHVDPDQEDSDENY
jgi:hypothetical protein